MDVAIPADRNVMHKETEETPRYKGLYIEMQLMWNMKCMIVP